MHFRSFSKLPALAAVLLLALPFVSAQDLPVDKHPDSSSWNDLFASDLSNAIMEPGGWEMKGGVLRAIDHGTIWTKESYGDFILDMEFKVAEAANSGVFIRTGDIKNVLSAIEIQIHENTDGTKYGMVGAIYDAKPPSTDATKPAGEWNRFTLTMVGNRLYLVFNGKQVHNVNLDDWPEVGKNPDGTPNKFKMPLKDYAQSGQIGFQGIHGREGQPVWFRNLKIKRLN